MGSFREGVIAEKSNSLQTAEVSAPFPDAMKRIIFFSIHIHARNRSLPRRISGSKLPASKRLFANDHHGLSSETA